MIGWTGTIASIVPVFETKYASVLDSLLDGSVCDCRGIPSSLLRRLARGELGRGPMHVVLTTHSASLLEFASPEEVRLLCRQDDGSVDIREVPSGTEEWRQTFEEYGRSFGSVWLSGGLGGVP